MGTGCGDDAVEGGGGGRGEGGAGAKRRDVKCPFD